MEFVVDNVKNPGNDEGEPANYQYAVNIRSCHLFPNSIDIQKLHFLSYTQGNSNGKSMLKW